MAMTRLGQSQLKPSKGYHFAKGAYVEYIGNVDNAVKDKLKDDIQRVANEIIKEQAEKEGVFSRVVSYEEGGKLLKEEVPSYMPKGEDFRVVKLTPEDGGCPCGGTHVQHVLDIVEIEITKI